MKRFATAIAGLAMLAGPALADTKADARLHDIGFVLAVIDRLADRCGVDAAAVAATKASRRERALQYGSAERLQQVEAEERAKVSDEVLARMDCQYVRDVVAAQ